MQFSRLREATGSVLYPQNGTSWGLGLLQRHRLAKQGPQCFRKVGAWACAFFSAESASGLEEDHLSHYLITISHNPGIGEGWGEGRRHFASQLLPSGSLKTPDPQYFQTSVNIPSVSSPQRTFQSLLPGLLT